MTVATLEKRKSSTLSIWSWECLLEHEGTDIRKSGSYFCFESALKALAYHQTAEHACPDCKGACWLWYVDYTATCPRCNGHGVELEVPPDRQSISDEMQGLGFGGSPR